MRTRPAVPVVAQERQRPAVVDLRRIQVLHQPAVAGPAAVLRLDWIFFANDNTPDAVSRLTKARYSVIPTKMAAESCEATP